MNIKKKLVNVWNDTICDGVNRKALKRYVYASRLWHKGNTMSRFLAMLLNRRNTRLYGCNIYPQAKLGDGVYIPHFVGITIGSTTEIGNDCVIFPNVVFGAAYSPKCENPKGRRHPKCGDHCIFGANSTIIGDISIGNNVIVGAGSVITKDIPSDSVVVGNNQIVRSNNETKIRWH